MGINLVSSTGIEQDWIPSTVLRLMLVDIFFGGRGGRIFYNMNMDNNVGKLDK